MNEENGQPTPQVIEPQSATSPPEPATPQPEIDPFAAPEPAAATAQPAAPVAPVEVASAAPVEPTSVAPVEPAAPVAATPEANPALSEQAATFAATPAAPQQPAVDPFAAAASPAEMPQPAPLAPEPPKNKKKLFIILGAIIGAVLLIIAVLGGLFVYANIAASNYDKQITASLDDNEYILDMVTIQGDDASEKLDQASEALTNFQSSKPKLAPVPLGAVLSPNYKKAKDADTAITNALDKMITAVDTTKQYLNVAEEMTALADEAEAAITQATSTTPTAASVGTLVTELKAITKKAEAIEVDEMVQPLKDEFVTFLTTTTAEFEKVQKDPTNQQTVRSAQLAIVTAANTYTREARTITRDIANQIKDNLNSAIDELNAATQ